MTMVHTARLAPLAAAMAERFAISGSPAVVQTGSGAVRIRRP